MRKGHKYTDEPLGQIQVIKDFLPAPSELVDKEDTDKVTIGLSRRSGDFFKRQAQKHETQYQKMIRRLLDLYVNRQGTWATLGRCTSVSDHFAAEHVIHDDDAVLVYWAAPKGWNECIEEGQRRQSDIRRYRDQNCRSTRFCSPGTW
jgi:hypothetical protein